MSAPEYACPVDTYVNAGVDEHGDFWFDAECNGPQDCGWIYDLRDSGYTVSTSEWPQLEGLHREHSAAKATR